jgi:hypothetical protein
MNGFLDFPYFFIIIRTPAKLRSSKWCLFPLGFRTKNLYAFLFSLFRATYPTYLIFFGMVTLIIFGKEYSWRSFSFCSFFQVPVTSYLLGPHTRVLQDPMLKHPYRYSCLNVRYPVSHPYQTIGKIMVLYVLVFIYLYSKRKDKIFLTEW